MGVQNRLNGLIFQNNHFAPRLEAEKESEKEGYRDLEASDIARHKAYILESDIPFK